MPEAWHVGRTLRMLELLSASPLSVPQLSAAMDAQPRTVRRVLSRLVDDGFVVSRQDGRNRRYEPTMRLVALAGQVVEGSRLARAARPLVELLHERSGAAAHLVVPSYGSVVCIAHADAPGGEVLPRVRELVPAHCTAGGKALLAWRDRWRESVLAAELTAHTPRTVVDAGALRHELERVRAQGFATEDGEYQDGVRAVAAPVSEAGEVVAALTISGKSVDLGEGPSGLTAIARRLADDLGRGPR